MNVTLVAYYGAKRPELENYLRSINDFLLSEFGCLYTPYSIEQIHATIVGLEHEIVDNKFLNCHFLRNRKIRKEMDLASLVYYLNNDSILPAKIRMGGFSAEIDYGFTSQGLHPKQRSLSISLNKVICIGWPVKNKQVTTQLGILRKSVERFNIVHKWHQHLDDFDNDLYFMLGHLQKSQLELETIVKVANKLRSQIANQLPIEFDCSIADLKFVAYDNLTLPYDNTHTIALTEVYKDLSNLKKLFEL